MVVLCRPADKQASLVVRNEDFNELSAKDQWALGKAQAVGSEGIKWDANEPESARDSDDQTQ